VKIECIVSLYICPMKDKIEQIKQKQERLAELLDLYRKAVENEGRLYHLFEDTEVNQWLYYSDYKYYFVNRETKEVVFYGSKQIVKSYMRINNIKSVEVMNDVSNFGGW
jgi:hypothetical protein